MMRAPVALASGSSGWVGSGSITTTRAGRPWLVSRRRSGNVMASRPVSTTASRTIRARSRPTGCRHSTAAAAVAPTRVAPTQTARPSCRAGGIVPGQPVCSPAP